MCDTIVATSPSTADQAVWFGKNSDREPGEAQVVEHLSAQRFTAPAKLQCTYIEIPQAAQTYEVVISRPFWMWGAEMGANERGVAIGNEAVFTRLPVPKTGLTGMDLLRIAIERSATAREALELIARLIAEVGQGGLCGYRHKGFRYHNSFIIADPKPVGGSMLRIYRDLRFSKSKEPYKPMVAASFYHQMCKDGGAPGIYLHLDPDHRFLGLGIYQPDTVTRRKITDAIAAKPEAWGKAITSSSFRKLCKLEGESLSKLPKQYDPDHPFAEDLKRKDFIASAYFSERQVCAKDFIDKFDAVCQASKGLLEFLAKAVGVKW